MDRRQFLEAAAATVAAAAYSPVETAAKATMTPAGSKDPKGILVRFLGTGAADWKGRDDRGELRRLSSVLIDNDFLIDFTPTDADMLPKDVHPTTIFYTHSHADHYNAKAAVELGIRQVYLNHSWYEFAVKDFEAAAKELGKAVPAITPVNIGTSIDVNGLKVTALPANHGTGHTFEQTMMYLLEKKGARVIYATDTGGIPSLAARIAGIDAHVKPGNPITGLIMEATMGMDHDIDFRIFTHSSVGLVERTATVLEQTGRYTPVDKGQPVYLTHMARTLHGTQAELDANLPKNLKAAYDGLEVIFKFPGA
ncbi:MAG: MBL fold metallo-hydrolase [Bacteroidales bacterium]|nr:MBL fold metallo-hydrolase [Bacteroidales bacterium]